MLQTVISEWQALLGYSSKARNQFEYPNIPWANNEIMEWLVHYQHNKMVMDWGCLVVFFARIKGVPHAVSQSTYRASYTALIHTCSHNLSSLSELITRWVHSTPFCDNAPTLWLHCSFMGDMHMNITYISCFSIDEYHLCSDHLIKPLTYLVRF